MKKLTIRPYWAITTLFILIFTVACQPTATTPDSTLVSPVVGEVVDSFVVQPQASLEPIAPPIHNYTNIPDVDSAIALILSNDLAERRNLVEFTTVGCTLQLGMGGPPKCEDGLAEGTPITFFPILGLGEGMPIMPGNIDKTIDFVVTELVAVYRPAAEVSSSDAFPLGKYSLLFAMEEGYSGVTVQLINGRIIRLDFGSFPVEELIQQINGEILYNRYPQFEGEVTENTSSDKIENQEPKMACLPRTNWPTYTIVAGDNLYTLAGDLETTIATLAEANCLEHPENLMPGQSIYVPTLPTSVTPEPEITATLAPQADAPRIIEFVIDQPVFRPGAGEEISVIWNASSMMTEICFNYANNVYRECQHVSSSGKVSHKLNGDASITTHWLDITIEAANGDQSVVQSERVLLRCQYAWFKDGLSDWCPAEVADGRPAQAQWFDGGLIVVEDHYADVIFNDPGTPCLSYKGLPNLMMDTTFLSPPNGRFLPEATLGKLYLGQFPKSETIQSRLQWGTSELVDFTMQMQCEQTPDGAGQCFSLAPDGRVYSNTAVSNRLTYEDNISVGEGSCSFVN